MWLKISEITDQHSRRRKMGFRRPSRHSLFSSMSKKKLSSRSSLFVFMIFHIFVRKGKSAVSPAPSVIHDCAPEGSALEYQPTNSGQSSNERHKGFPSIVRPVRAWKERVFPSTSTCFHAQISTNAVSSKPISFSKYLVASVGRVTRPLTRKPSVS